MRMSIEEQTGNVAQHKMTASLILFLYLPSCLVSSIITSFAPHQQDSQTIVLL